MQELGRHDVEVGWCVVPVMGSARFCCQTDSILKIVLAERGILVNAIAYPWLWISLPWYHCKTQLWCCHLHWSPWLRVSELGET
jgi:hypothetical protein